MQPPFRHVRIIANPAAGGGCAVGALHDLFDSRGIAWEADLTRKPGDAKRLAEQAAASCVDAVVACGGDGTLMEVASGLVGSEVPLGVLPSGTGNVMAVELGVGLSLQRAAALIYGGLPSEVRALDVGQIKGQAGARAFLMRASAGFEAVVAQETDPDLKNRIGVLAYGVAALQALRGAQRAQYHLSLDGRALICEGVSCLIANAGSIGRLNLSISPRISTADGRLDVIVASREVEFALSVAANTFRLKEFAAWFHHWQAREIVVEADPPQPVQVDGDHFGETPIAVSVMPKAIRVIAPAA
ncbi:MAG: diacylglycerol kinase family lipid kinase [Anaerolineae bacterium]|nr:diacylglycerol kinase family lipid kinase [Anaerolineae bacterium]